MYFRTQLMPCKCFLHIRGTTAQDVHGNAFFQSQSQSNSDPPPLLKKKHGPSLVQWSSHFRSLSNISFWVSFFICMWVMLALLTPCRLTCILSRLSGIFTGDDLFNIHDNDNPSQITVIRHIVLCIILTSTIAVIRSLSSVLIEFRHNLPPVTNLEISTSYARSLIWSRSGSRTSPTPSVHSSWVTSRTKFTIGGNPRLVMGTLLVVPPVETP